MSGSEVVKCAGCETYYNRSSVPTCTCGCSAIIAHHLQGEESVSFDTVEQLRQHITKQGIVKNTWKLSYDLLTKALAEVGYKLTQTIIKR